VAAQVPVPDAGDEPLPCELLAVMGDSPRAVTYLAEQTWPVRRLVTLKLFKPGWKNSDPRRDAGTGHHATSALRHPNIAYVVESGVLGDQPYVMTEYLAGGPVTRCYDQHHLGLGPRLEALVAMSAALEFAHSHDVVHGRVSTSNALCVGRSPFAVRLVDFESGATSGDVRIDLDGVLAVAGTLLFSPVASRDPRTDAAVSHALDDLGKRVQSARDLRQAFERLHTETPDL
jgi:serine/threonine protein kinase